jgi:hypothetical protein
MTGEAVDGSVVLAPWKCPECGQANPNTTATCTNKRYDETSPRFESVPPVPAKYSLYNLGEYFQELGLADVPPPAVVWRCSGQLGCPVPGCAEPARAYGHGPRCEDHSNVLAIIPT